MNQLSVTEQPLLKTRCILKEVGKEQYPLILLSLTWPLFFCSSIIKQQLSVEWTLLTILKKNCKCFYASLLKANACLSRWPEFLFHFCQNWKAILKYLLLFMNILKNYRLLLKEFIALLHNLTVISKAPLSVKGSPMVHLVEYQHTKKQSKTGEAEGRKHYKQDLLCLTLNLNHQPNLILIYSLYICNFLKYSANK